MFFGWEILIDPYLWCGIIDFTHCAEHFILRCPCCVLKWQEISASGTTRVTINSSLWRQTWISWFTFTICPQVGISWSRLSGRHSSLQGPKQRRNNHWWVSGSKGTFTIDFYFFKTMQHQIGIFVLYVRVCKKKTTSSHLLTHRGDTMGDIMSELMTAGSIIRLCEKAFSADCWSTSSR